MIERVTRYAQRITDFLFPRFCFGCGITGSYLCKNCLVNKLKINYQTICLVCDKPVFTGLIHKECEELSFLDGLVFFTLYNKLARKLIKTVKYSGNFDVIFEVGDLMGKYLKTQTSIDLTNCILSYVPLAKSRELERGFNQAKLVAERIGKACDLKVESTLERYKFQKTQASLSGKDRRTNTLRSFKARTDINPNKNIILIDDVFTTGSTLNSCAKVLKEKGVQKVYAYVFAKSGIIDR